MSQRLLLSGKVAVLTGCLGQIGIALTEGLLAEGATVVGIDVRSSSEGSIPMHWSDLPFHFFVGDIASSDSLQAIADEVASRWNGIDVLVNNAGIDSPPGLIGAVSGRFEDVPLAEFDRILRTNFIGVVNCCQVFAPLMAANGSGSIVNIGSIYASVSPDQSLYEYLREAGTNFFKPAAYGASKAAVVNLTKYLAVYWAKNSIRVNAISPSGVLAKQDSEFIQNYEKRIPIGRMAYPQELVGPLVFLSSDASSYVTGHELVVDGGWLSI